MADTAQTKQKKWRRPFMAAAVSFCLASVLCGVFITVSIRNRSGLEQATMEQVILEKSLKVNEVISGLIYKTQALSALVVQSDGEVQDFEKVATAVVDDPAILNVLIAPGGIVTEAYPAEGNEGLLGFDFFSQQAGNLEARTAVDKGEMVFSGPFAATQGRMILSGRLPVWRTKADGTKDFWGIVAVTLKYPEVLKGAGLEALQMQGFAYEIWRINPDDDQRQVIAQSSYQYNQNAHYIEKEMPIFNAMWHFRISPVRQWYQYADNWAVILSAFCICVLIAFIAHNNVELSRVKRVLERQERTSRKAALAAQEASRQKTAFLATMSHELRTPLHGIIGYSELAERDPATTDQTRTYLARIQDSARGLSQITDSILDVSKIEAGKIDLERIPFALEDVLRVCVENCSVKLAGKDVTLESHIDPALARPLLGDPTRLRQILLNLLSNAVKFTETGSVALECTVLRQDGENCTLRFEVRDTGIGMTAEQVQRVMQPFAQADTTTTRRYGGTGLGLAISSGLLSLRGSRLQVESFPGQGSRFFFDLDMPFAEEAAAPAGAADAESPQFAGQVLLCEDNAMNCEVAQTLLAQAGLAISLAGNGREALALAEEKASQGEAFDLILMDIYMPEMDGMEAACALRQAGCTTPIVALTANLLEEDRNAYRDAGMDGVLPKPFSAEDLYRLLAQYLPPKSGEAGPAVDHAAGLAVCGGDEERAARLRRQFAEENADAMQELEKAVADEDWKAAHRRVHTLKSTARLIGAGPLAWAATRAEESLKAKALPEAEHVALRDALKAVLAELEQEHD